MDPFLIAPAPGFRIYPGGDSRLGCRLSASPAFGTPDGRGDPCFGRNPARSPLPSMEPSLPSILVHSLDLFGLWCLSWRGVGPPHRRSDPFQRHCCSCHSGRRARIICPRMACVGGQKKISRVGDCLPGASGSGGWGAFEDNAGRQPDGVFGRRSSACIVGGSRSPRTDRGHCLGGRMSIRGKDGVASSGRMDLGPRRIFCPRGTCGGRSCD